jgi:hypothetical protein
LGPTDGEIVPGGIIMESIDKPADGDVFTLNGTAGQVALLTTTQTGGNFNIGVRARTTIYRPDGTALLTYDANSSRLITLPETGEYVVTVYASNLFNDGTYSIGLELISPVGPTDGTINQGATITDAVSAPADIDVFTFDGSAGQVVVLTTTQTGGGFNIGVRARTTVYDPNGAALLTYDATSTRSITLPSAGQYIVTVAASNLFTAGTYTLMRQ